MTVKKNFGEDLIGEDNLDISITPIISVVKRIAPITADLSCHTVSHIFDTEHYEGLCVIDRQNHPIGLIMKNNLSAKLGTQYGYSIYAYREIEQVLDFYPIIVDCNTPIKDVSEMITVRSDDKVYDNVIVTKNNQYLGIVSIKDLLMHITNIEKNYATHLNPLTMLPGNQMINYHIKQQINKRTPCAIFYADLDNFKVYNDLYGFEHGDRIIKITASCIEDTVKIHSDSRHFIGHIGGDDFVFIIYENLEKTQSICQDILSNFSVKIRQCFSAPDLQNGYLQAKDRDGELKRFSLTSLSIAGFVGRLTEFKEVENFSRYIGRVKKETKELKGNSYILYNSDREKIHSYKDRE